jgi:hypothetical protein
MFRNTLTLLLEFIMQTELAVYSPPIAGLPFRGWDFIYAQHPEPKDSPVWYTEKRFPLSGELVDQGAYLYGVRFGPTTQYAMLDIDRGSPYHPACDPHAWRQICEVLEPLGLVRYLLCQSSDSGGLHIYFPWEGASLKSFEVGQVLTVLLESKGFKPGPGRLEVFPNPKPYRGKDNPSLYNAHRLPLQRGFYLLEDSGEPHWTTRQGFIEHWQLAAVSNDINAETSQQLLRQFQRRRYPVSTSAEKFLNDLNAAIEPGWERAETDPPFLWDGQEITPKTNALLGRIAIRAYVFGHIDGLRPPLEGEALIDEIVKVAMALPGYDSYCRHKHEIRKRASQWARCVEASHYFHYGIKKTSAVPVVEQTWHEQKAMEARERITKTLAALLEEGALPSAAGARAKLLVARCRMSQATLYKYKELWHPDHIKPLEENAAGEDNPNVTDGLSAFGGARPQRYRNLLEAESCNSLSNKGFSNIQPPENKIGESCNRQEEPQLPESDPEIDEGMNIEDASTAIARARQQIAEGLAQRRAQTTQNREEFLERQRETARQAHRLQLEAWLASGDPILMQEARQQLRLEDDDQSRQGEGGSHGVPLN